MTRQEELEYAYRQMSTRLSRLERRNRRRLATEEEAQVTDLRDLGDVATFLDFSNQSVAPIAPPEGTARLYVDSAGDLTFVDSGGVVIFMGSAPAVFVAKSGTQSIPNAETLTAVTFDVEVYDTDAMHSTAANTHRLVAPVAGVYHVWGCASWAAAVFPRVGTMIRDQSGVEYAHAENSTAGTEFLTQALSADVSLVAGEWVELTVWHTHAVGAQNLNDLANTVFGMHWVRPAP